MHPSIEKAKEQGRHLLEPEALGLLQDHGIAVPRHAVVRAENEVLEAADGFGWPVVMKIVSPDILHKTESGGVILNIQNEKQAIDAFSRLTSLRSGGARVEGCIIYPYQSHDLEFSVGMLRDPQFGPVITFGLGGVWIEVFRDITYGIAPLSHEEADDMLQSVRAHSILEGMRGRAPADRQALCDLLVRLSRMAMNETAIQEIDLNPIFPLEQGYFIADARVIL